MSTLPRRLAELAAARPTEVAVQEKRFGIWHPISWAEYAAHVRDFAGGLAALGVGRGDAVGIAGDNRPEWLIAELAAHCLGAAAVGISPTSTDDDALGILTASGVRVCVVEDQEQVDKLARLGDRLRDRLRDRPSDPLDVIYWDPHGLEHYPADTLHRFTEVLAAGRRDAAERPGWLDGEIAAGTAADIALVCAPSGERSADLARLSHADLLALADRLVHDSPLQPGQRHVSLLPLGSIAEQALAVACGLAFGLTVAFAEEASTTEADLREIGPDVVLGPPRMWHRMRQIVEARVADAGWLGRRAFRWAHGVGDAIAQRRARGVPPGVRLATVHRVADRLALGAAREHLGLSRARRGYAAGAPLSPELTRFFRALGVELVPADLPAELAGDPPEAAPR